MVMVILILVVIGLGVWVWLKPVLVPAPVTPEEHNSACLEEAKIISDLIEAIKAEDIGKCKTVESGLFREYCNAWYNDEKACLSLEEDNRKKCLAILKRDLEQCEGDNLCYGVISSLESCEQLTDVADKSTCAALARRDSVAFSEGVGCDITEKRYSEQYTCLEAANSVEEVETCEKLAQS